MISIIIPAYNEENRIRKTIDSLIEFFNGRDYEIIVSSNGCRDRTDDVIKKYSASNKRIRLISSTVAGKGLALQRGFNHSEGDIVIFADADNSSGPQELWKLVKMLENYDAVIGSRSVKKLIAVRQPFKREFFGKVMSLLVRVLFRIGIRDTQCGYKAFKREVLEGVFNNVRSSGLEFDVELLVRIKKAGYKIKEQPIRWDDNKDSRIKVFPDALKMLYNIIKFRVQFSS